MDKERLVGLISKKQVYGIDQEQPNKRDLLLLDNDELADFLLANGVIVPPCKVGQTVYVITNKHPCYACKWCSVFCYRDCHIENKTELVVRKAKVDAVCFLDGVNEIHVEIEGTKNLHSYRGTFNFCDFGKTVFLTREQAENALAERSKE